MSTEITCESADPPTVRSTITRRSHAQHNLHPARRKLALRDNTLGWWAHRGRARLLARCCLDHHRHELAGPAGALRLAEQTPPRENLIGVEVVALGQQLGLLDNVLTSNEAETESMAHQVACY